MKKNDIELMINFNKCDENKPQHMQRCLCYDSYMPGYYCYVYDDISKYWCNQYTDEHDANGDNHVCDYADGRVTKWVALSEALDYCELLFNDLCGRLPYKVKINHPDFGEDSCEVLDTLYNLGKSKEKYFKVEWEDEESAWHGIDRLKPYLYPMSAMSEEMKYEYSELSQKLLSEHENVVVNSVKLIEFFNRNSIDYNGLIDKGIAIDIRNLCLEVNDKVDGECVDEGISSKFAVAGDICLYNKISNRLVIIPFVDFDNEKYTLNKYSPVGVVVIPGSHDEYGDGSSGVMSLKEMNYNTPDTGSTDYQSMYWGQYNVDISNMTNYNKVYYVGSKGTVNKNVIGVTDYAYLPSDSFMIVQDPYDKDTYFTYNDSDKYIPSPYNDDDTRNPAYYQTTSSISNAMSDFDGVGNTDKLINLVTGQSDWKTASSIANNDGSGYSPAACCCWRYHTEGTKQGDWYLPAMGELGYIMPKFNKIQQTINTLISAYGSTVGVQVNDGYYYWSSSECSSEYARTLDTYGGGVGGSSKGYILFARAFLHVKI